jgi:hypothetical protein
MIETLLGIALLSTVLVDIIVTTLTMRAAGPVTSRAMPLLWRLALRMTPSGAHRLLVGAGIAVVGSTILAWALLSWAGWALVFLGADGELTDTSTHATAGIWDTVYFAGTTLFTLGPGDFAPQSAVWRLLTVLCAASGLLAMTLSVTYIVPVLSAAAGRRQLAAQIHSIGSTPQGILRWGWDGRGFSRLGNELDNLAPAVILVSQQHLAYPALHYFHSDHTSTSLPLRIAALDEALSVLLSIRPETAPEITSLEKMRTAIAFLLSVMSSAHIKAAHQPPPPPSIEGLGFIPPLSAGTAGLDFSHWRARRELLLGWVENDGRDWGEVAEPAGDSRAFPLHES